MSRDTGSITQVHLRYPELEIWEFVKIVFPDAVRYFTNRPEGFNATLGEIDGLVVFWEEFNFTHGPLKQGLHKVMDVNWFKAANLDNYFTNLDNLYGLKDKEITIYTAWWDASVTPSVFVDGYIEYEGLTDNHEIRKDYVNISLKPFHTGWNQRVPQSPIEGRCTNDYRNLEDCQYTGAEPAGETSCDKTRRACRLRGNEIHANIYDDAPKSGDILYWGGKSHGLSISPNQG